MDLRFIHTFYLRVIIKYNHWHLRKYCTEIIIYWLVSHASDVIIKSSYPILDIAAASLITRVGADPGFLEKGEAKGRGGGKGPRSKAPRSSHARFWVLLEPFSVFFSVILPILHKL